MGKEDYKNEKKGHGFLCVPKELLFDEGNITYRAGEISNTLKKSNIQKERR